MRIPLPRLLAFVGTLIATLAVSTPAYAVDYHYWTARAADKVYRTTAVPATRGTSTNASVRLGLVAARSEFEGRQLIIRPTGGGVRDVWLQPSELVLKDASGAVVATIPAREVSTYKVHYVNVTTPSTGYKTRGLHPDPLLPMTLANGERLGWRVGGGMDTAPRAIASGVAQPFYVLFHVPGLAKAGTYTGTVTVTCTGDNGVALPTLRVPVSLTVYPFSVAAKTLKTAFEINLKWAGQAASIKGGFLGKDTDVEGEDRVYEGTTFKADQYRGWFQYMSDHRISSQTMVPAWENGDDWAPGDDAGNMVARQEYLDDYLGTGPATTFVGERFGFNTVTIPEQGARLAKDPFANAADTAKAARYYSTMTKELGPYAKRAYAYMIDEPSGGRAFIERYAAFIHKYAPGTKFLLTTAGNVWDYKPLKGVDTYVQRLHFYYRDNARWLKPLRKAGKEIWMYSHATTWQRETPLFLIDKPLAESRSIPWFAYHGNASGYLYYSINRWGTDSYRDPYVNTLSAGNSVVKANGDGSLVYPGFYPALGMRIQGSPPVGSLRMEALRDGLEDHEYLKLIERDSGRGYADYYVSRIIGAPKTVVSGGKATFPAYSKQASDYDSVRASMAHRLGASTAYQSIAGANRYETAVKASRTGFTTAPCVVIATGTNWPDALGGASLAAAEGGPILLTKPDILPAEVMSEIRRLKATRAIVLGSRAAVSGSVENQLVRALGRANVTRIGGSNRYETAARVARATVTRLGDAYDGKAFVATGGSFPDALAASPLSAARGWPILLSSLKSGLPAETTSAMRAIGVSEVFVLGASSAVSAAVENALVRTYGDAKVTRFAGSDRYATAAKVANLGVSRGGLSFDGLALATGSDFPDALAGGVLQGKSGSVLLLTQRTSLHGSPRAVSSANRAQIHSVRFLGGTSALGVAPREQLRAVLN